MFIDRLVDEIQKKESCVLVGLDPRLGYIPDSFKKEFFNERGKNLDTVGDIILAYNKVIIDHVYDIVPAVKPQIAFYEQYGLAGLRAYIETCDYAKSKGLLVIGDVKRGDIGTTSKAYSNAHLGCVDLDGEKFSAFDSDAITTNPYLGDDCLKEFMDDISERNKGMFVLVKTSNPTSGQLQDLEVGNKKIYEIVSEIVYEWSLKTLGKCGYSSVGAVVSATHPQQAKDLRRLMKKTYFLVPGYGAQGGTVEDVLGCFNEDGLGAIINSSRGIMYAYRNKDKNYDEYHIGEASRNETLIMKESINEALKAITK